LRKGAKGVPTRRLPKGGPPGGAASHANIDQQFLAAGLVDEIRIHLVNVLLERGRRLFDELPQRIELEQTGLSQTDGVTHLDHRVLRWRCERLRRSPGAR
jgi:RibD C-terminal domain